METKKRCPCCGEVKLFSKFHKSKNRKYGLAPYCKMCYSKKHKRIKEDIKKNLLPKPNEYYETNFKKCNKCGEVKALTEFQKRIVSKDGVGTICKDCNREKNNASAKKNRDKKRITMTEEDWEKQRERDRGYHHKNKIHRNGRQMERYYANRKKHIKVCNDYRKRREAIDPLYKFKNNIRKHMLNCFKRRGLIKGRITKEVLGCELKFFKQYIEAQFTEGMSWDSFGVHGWNYDHIIPLDNANTEEEVIKLCHYTNYQPMWAIPNKQKGNNFPEGYQKRLL